MKFYDLFAGIGGFRLGLECNGFECVGSCEIDKYARKVYSSRFGDNPDYDARQLDASTLPDFDILTAGFPCQAFSIAGQRLGFSEPRGTLFFEIARIAREKRPQILFLENVKGLLNHDGGRTFAVIINTLYELGYDVEWQIINGKYFLPQNRERVYIIGHLRDKPSRQIFPITEINKEYNGIPKPLQTKSALIHSRGFEIREDGISHCIKGACGGYSKNFLLDKEMKIRKLTPLECERLMGFPDNWTEGVSDTQRYKLLGNSVMIPLIELIVSSFLISNSI